MLTHSCMPCLVYMPIKSAMPKYHSKFPIAFYAHLVSFSNIRSILSNRTYTTEFVISSHARFNIIMQAALQFYLEAKSPFSIDSDYKVDIYCWRDTMKKRIAAMKKSLDKIKKRLQWDSNHVPVSYVALRVNGCLHLGLLGTPIDERWVL